MVDEWVVEISRWQFAASALYHFLFVPLTLGLSLLIAVMETLYVRRGGALYREMALFWGRILLINFSIGVITGLTLEFQFGSSWGFFARFAGGVLGMPLVLESLLSFVLQAVAIGLMWLGWERFSRGRHLATTWLVVLSTHVTAYWILTNDNLMQWPEGLHLGPALRAQAHGITPLLFNGHGLSAFVHTCAAAYLIAATCVCGTSAWYLLSGRHIGFARASFRVAALFGLTATLAVLTLGDAYSGFAGHLQAGKMVAIDGADSADVSRFEQRALQRVRSGSEALLAMQQLRKHPSDAAARAQFLAHRDDLGYGLLLKRVAPQGDVTLASPGDLRLAARSALPDEFAVHWSYVLMLALGAVLLVYFLVAAMRAGRDELLTGKGFLRLSLWMIPIPFAAAEAGWVVNEMGRQPWMVHDLLPTWAAVSARSVTFLTVSMGSLAFLHMVLVVLELYLLMRTVQQGPAYHWGTPAQNELAQET